MTRHAFLPPLFGLVLSAAPASAMDCPAERAGYELVPDPRIRLSFVPAQHFASMATNLYVKLTTTQRSYWFTVQTSNGYGGMSLRAVGDPYVAANGDPDNGPVEIGIDEDDPGAMGIHPFSETFELLRMPQKGEPAPPYIFTPDLGRVLWYSPKAISSDPVAQRDPMERGAFRLVQCQDEAPPEAYP